MRLMIIGNHIYPDYVAGTEIAIYNFAKQLTIKPVQLALALNDYRQKFNSSLLKQFRILPVKEFNFRFISAFIRYLSLIRRLIQFKPDVIVVFAMLDFALIGTLYRIITKKKIIVRTEGSDIVLPSNLYTYLIRKFVCNKADQILYVSSVHLPLILQNRPKRYPINLANGASTRLQVKNREVKPIATQILFVGTLREVKNLQTLLKALKTIISQIGKTSKEIKLTLCGKGPLLKKLQRQAEDLGVSSYVLFAGQRSQEELKTYYENTDVFILPSLSEGFPLVVAEALNYGCPLICSRIPSLTSILKEGKNCLFFSPPTHFEALAEAIITLFNNFSLRREFAQNNLELAKQYQWSMLGDRLWEIIEKLNKTTT